MSLLNARTGLRLAAAAALGCGLAVVAGPASTQPAGPDDRRGAATAPDPALRSAQPLHELGVDGRGVTVALVGAAGSGRGSSGVRGRFAADGAAPAPAARPLRESTGVRLGRIAPGAGWIVVEALDGRGRGSYLDVLKAVDWVVTRRQVHDVRVLVLPLAAGAGHYWQDPLGRAVMEAWRAGIVVVAAAGESGSLPGSVPYVITVDGVGSEGSPRGARPTARMPAFAKPDVLVPGARRARLEPGALPAAVVVGEVVALLLQREPWLTPDEVKCRLLASARPVAAATGDGDGDALGGAPGTVDAWAAATSDARGCANRGLDLELDLGAASAPERLAHPDAVAEAGFLWNGVWMWSDAYRWSASGRGQSRSVSIDGYM